MHRLSSNATLFLKLFIPVFWTTILIGVNLVAWFAPEHYFGGLPLQSFRWAVLFLLAINLAFFIFVLWPLKRVESDGDNVYISNYFRTAFYSWERDVEALHITRILLIKVATIELNGVGSFGRRMRFIPAGKLLDAFIEAYPEKVNVERD